MILKNVDVKIFEDNLPNIWKETFTYEFQIYWSKVNSLLKGFYMDGKFIWWLRLWYNPDSLDKDGTRIIKELYKKWYTKISYFFILDEYRWNLYWKHFILSVIGKNGNFFLTCQWNKLEQYYIYIWFKLIYKSSNKSLLVYENSITQ